MALNQIHVSVYDNTSPPGANGVEPIQDGSLTVKPILAADNASFGAEISGIDWEMPIPSHVISQLVSLQDKYAVIVFRRTGLDNARHIAFSQQLGEKLEINPFFYGQENDRLGEPLLFDVGNIQRDGSLVQPSSRRWQHSLGNALWHTDSSYHQQRAKYSLLLSHGEVAAGESWTHFADTRSAYADLPQSKKDEIAHLIIEHDLWHSRKLASPAAFHTPLPHELAAKPPAYHRLVQTAPDGRKTLYLAAHAKRILGKTLEESQELIWELIEHCTQSKYVFSMEWISGGDMVWWDNRQSMHRANPYSEGMAARDVRRSTIFDEGPFAYGVTEEERLAAEPM